MNPVNDISIGEDKWIEWKDFDKDSVQPLEIDGLFRPTIGFWRRVENECVKECCGIHAFGFWQENIIRAAKNTYSNTLKEDLVELKESGEDKTDCVISSDLLNQVLAKEVFVKLLEHIIKTMDEQSNT